MHPIWSSEVEFTMFGKAFHPVIGIPFAAVTVVAIVVFSPVLVPLHFGLKACGRQGFVSDDGDTVRIVLGFDGFQRRLHGK